MPQKCFLTGQPSDLLRKSLAIFIEEKSFRQIYQSQRSARATAEATKGQSDAAASQAQTSSISKAIDHISKKGGRNKKNKKDMKKVSQLSHQEVERRALEELEILRLKKRAIFTKIRERKERKIKEAASSNQL